MKKCTKCKIEKPLKDFSKAKNKKDGLRGSCKSCDKEYKKQWGENNKEHSKQYYENNKEQRKDYYKETNKQWRENNKEYRKEYTNEYRKQRKQTDSIYKFRCAIRCNIGSAFKRGKNQFKKNARTEQILGCTTKEFILYIQSQFKKGMTFENHGLWHLDHIIPLATATTEEEIIKLNHYTNFQPLWAKENISKGDKIIEKQLKLL